MTNTPSPPHSVSREALDEHLLEQFTQVKTELATVQRELADKTAQVERLLEEQERMRRVQEDVERIMRHDLKSPLTTIINVPQMMLGMGGQTEDQARLLRSVEQAGRRMLRQIDLSRDVYLMELGSYEAQPAPLDLGTVLRLLAEEFEARLVDRQVGLDLFLDDKPLEYGMRLMARGEELLCRSMLANLLENAMEATPKGGRVRIYLGAEVDRAVVRIHNQGQVPEEMRRTFFQKYATSGKPHGNGLGTYSAQLMARVQGGDVEMDTGPVGTLLSVYLPLA